MTNKYLIAYREGDKVIYYNGYNRQHWPENPNQVPELAHFQYSEALECCEDGEYPIEMKHAQADWDVSNSKDVFHVIELGPGRFFRGLQSLSELASVRTPLQARRVDPEHVDLTEVQAIVPDARIVKVESSYKVVF